MKTIRAALSNEKADKYELNNLSNDGVSGVITQLIKEAAKCVRGDGLPSSFQEDHNKHVPKWILTIFEDLHERDRVRAIKIKTAVDNLRTSLQAQTKEGYVLAAQERQAVKDEILDSLKRKNNPAYDMFEFEYKRALDEADKLGKLRV